MEEAKAKYQQEWEALEKEEKTLALEKKKLSEEWVQIEKQQQAYEKDRATFEKLVLEKFEFLPDDTVVNFNIGGKLFKSTVKVWTRDRFSILAQLCTAKPKLKPDSRGHFFFDRDWWVFKLIYAFLRDKTLPPSIDTLRDLYYEASYYRITLLRHAIEAYLKNHSSTDIAKVHQSYTHNHHPTHEHSHVAERIWSHDENHPKPSIEHHYPNKYERHHPPRAVRDEHRPKHPDRGEYCRHCHCRDRDMKHIPPTSSNLYYPESPRDQAQHRLEPQRRNPNHQSHREPPLALHVRTTHHRHISYDPALDFLDKPMQLESPHDRTRRTTYDKHSEQDERYASPPLSPPLRDPHGFLSLRRSHSINSPH